MSGATNKLELAQKHLEKVLIAWDDPTDWADLSLYGFYALEAAVDAARIHFGIDATKSHASRSGSAKRLSSEHGLEDVSDLLRDLNEARKSEAYGDIVTPPELDPEDVAVEIEKYIESVATLIGAP